MKLSKINLLNILKYPAIILITAYQWLISPLFPRTCRFYPSCSTYSRTAFEQYNFFTALWLSVRRLMKCHPFHPGGYDPLPPNKESL